MPDGSLLVTMDVVGVYSNLPIQDSIDVAVKHLETHKKDIDMLDLVVGDIRNLLEHVLGNNVFEFGNTQFRQTTGIAMGNNLVPLWQYCVWLT